MKVDLTTELFGIRLSSPLILGSGPLSYGADGMIRAHRAGAGAVVTKTIRDQAAINPLPHIAVAGKDSLINAEKWTDIPGEQWVRKEIPQAKEAGVIVIASLGHTPEEVGNWIEPVDRAGANMIEVTSYLQETLTPMTEQARASTDKPVLAKVSPNWNDPVQAAQDALAAGADGITAIDSIGHVLRVDITTARPLMGSKWGMGWLTGAALKPIALRYVYEIATRIDRPIIGMGGVISPEDAIEMLMVGAGAIGVCTAPMLKGLTYLTTLNERIEVLLENLGYPTIASVSGAAIPNFPEEEVVTEYAFSFDASRCVECNRCVEVCAYQARTLTDKVMELDQEICRYCGLCASVCPTDALIIN